MTTSSLAELRDEWLYLTVIRGCRAPMLNEPSVARRLRGDARPLPAGAWTRMQSPDFASWPPAPVTRRSASTRTSSLGSTESVTLMLRSVMLDHR